MPTDEHASSPMVPNAENSGKPALGATSATPSSMVDVMPGDAPRHSPDLRDDNGHSRPALHPILPAGADVPGGRPAHISMSIVSITQGTHSASIPLDPSRIHPSKLPRSENIMTDPTHSPGYTSVSSTTTSTASTTSPHTAVPPPLPTGGESIYRTIMNRLTALEANHTLYARYVEEQTAGVREALRRLAEDVGRLEGIVSMLCVPCSLGRGFAMFSTDPIFLLRPKPRRSCISDRCLNGRDKGTDWEGITERSCRASTTLRTRCARLLLVGVGP
jgi:hypothetical protein